MSTKITEKTLAPGQVYLWHDPQTFGEASEITIVGFDPYTQQWVASSKAWCLGLSHLDAEDFECMTLKG